jgi:hypothetical protein
LARTNEADNHPTEDDDNESVNSDDFDAAIQLSSKIDLDFASALEADIQSEDDEIAQNSSSEEEEMEGSDSDFEAVDDFDNLSDEVMPSESEEENNTSLKINGNKKLTKSTEKSKIAGKRKASYDLADLMASAEDYEQLIEDDMANDIEGISGSINEASNKDKSNTKQLNKCVSILKSKPKIKRTMWSRRAQEYEQKINSGKLYQLAEVVKDLNKKTDVIAEQSYSERQLFEKAYERLRSEFEVILGEKGKIKINKALKRFEDPTQAQESK